MPRSTSQVHKNLTTSVSTSTPNGSPTTISTSTPSSSPTTISYMSTLSGTSLTKFIKLQTMKYFRFDKKCILTCTEGNNNADVNSLLNNMLIEVEIKISKSDFRKEFNGESKVKLLKHQRYNSKYTQSGKSYKNYYVPNMFYFCTTDELAPYIDSKLDELGYINYGILVCREYRQFNKNSHIEVYRFAKKLHKEKVEQKCLEKLMKRLSNENINNISKLDI